MKIGFVFVLGSLILNSYALHADGLSTTPGESNKTAMPNFQAMLKNLTTNFMYSYIDFKFDSTTGDNFNRFTGHSNVYSLGADNVALSQSLSAGLYIFNINTDVDSQLSIAPGLPTTTVQSIHNNTLFAHLRKSFTPAFDVYTAVGYGQNKIAATTSIYLNAKVYDIGFAHNTNTNWFATINAFYKKSWKKVQFKPNVGVLYSEIISGSYPFVLRSGSLSQDIAPLINRVTYITEGLEIGYGATPEITPFINGGLIQVAQFSTSRPIAAEQINGSLPQLSMNKNGYRLGGGVNFTYKQFSLRLEGKYYNASKTFTSNQGIIGLEYRFS